MKRFSQQFKKQAESIRMRASERADLRERLVTYMEYHPVSPSLAQKNHEKSEHVEVSVFAPFKAIVFNKIYFRSFMGVFSVFLILGVPFVAEKSVPGDMLYPVKIQFNEELRSTLSLSPYAKVEWETTRLERRISEARLLASEGKLTDEAEARVALAVQSHSDAAQQSIAQLRQSDSDEAAIAEISFASALAVQSEMLEGHIEKDISKKDQNQEGRSVVALAGVVAKARASAEAVQTNNQPSYKKLLARVEQESTRVYELFVSVRDGASREEVTNVERRLADVQRKVEQAVALKANVSNTEAVVLSNATPNQEPAEDDVLSTTSTTSVDIVVSTSSENEATTTSQVTDEKDISEDEIISLLRSALIDIQKLLSYLTHIDVRENVSIEDLVPITPTNEERIAEISSLFDETLDLQQKIALHIVNEELQEKLSLGQVAITEQLAEIVTAMQDDDLDTALKIVTEARLMAVDLATLVADTPVKDIEGVDTERGTSTEEAAE
jgi:hypothetical protein